MKATTDASSPQEYIANLSGENKRDIEKFHKYMLENYPELKPHMQSGMLGYGSYHYKYASGREGDWFIMGITQRKHGISIYAPCATTETGYLPEKYQGELGKVNVGKSCIRAKKLADINMETLDKIIKESRGLVEKMNVN